jgi:hypothetical protein
MAVAQAETRTPFLKMGKYCFVPIPYHLILDRCVSRLNIVKTFKRQMFRQSILQGQRKALTNFLSAELKNSSDKRHPSLRIESGLHFPL